MDMITLAMLNSMKKSGGVGYTDTTAKTTNETVPMTKAGCYYRWDQATPYSDNGITEFSGTKATGTGSMWYSDVFEHDTVVTVTVLYGTTNANLRQYCACIPADTDIPASDNFTADVHYMEQIGTASTAEYTVQYTVRSGYRLAVINWNSGTPSQLSATADVLTMEETIHPIDPKFLPGVCLPKVIDLTKYDAGGQSLNDVVINLFASGGGTTSVSNTDGTDAFWRDISAGDNIRFLIDATNTKLVAIANSMTFGNNGADIAAVETSFLISPGGSTSRVTMLFGVGDEMGITVAVEPVTAG